MDPFSEFETRKKSVTIFTVFDRGTMPTNMVQRSIWPHFMEVIDKFTAIISKLFDNLRDPNRRTADNAKLMLQKLNMLLENFLKIELGVPTAQSVENAQRIILAEPPTAENQEDLGIFKNFINGLDLDVLGDEDHPSAKGL